MSTKKFKRKKKKNKNIRKCFVSPMKLNLRGTQQNSPPTWNPWNGSSGNRFQPNTSLNHHNESPPRVHRLFASSASTGGSTDSFDKRGRFSRQQYSTRLYSRSNKDKNQTKPKMKKKDAQLLRKRKNKFPASVPWISPMSNPWRFPRSTPPTRTELELIVC